MNQPDHITRPLPAARLAFVAMLLVYGFSYFHRTAIPGTIFNELQQELHLSASAIVALGSVFLWIYGSLQLVAGVAVDRFGGTRMLLFGGFFATVGAVMFPLAHTPEMLYTSRAIAAFGDSFVYLGIIKEVHLLFEQRRFTLMTGVVSFAAQLGGMMAMLPFERATHAFGWRLSLLATGGFMSLAMVANFVLLPKLKHFEPHTTTVTFRPVWKIIGNRRNWPLFVGAFVNFPVYFVLQVGIGKKFIQDFVGLSSQQAATFTLVMMTVSAGVCLASGFLLNHTGGRRKPYLILAVSLLLSALVLMLVGVFLHARAWVFLTSYILMAAAGIAGPIGTTVIKELNDSRHIGQAIALLNSISYISVAILLMLSGAVLDLFRADAARLAGGVIYPPQAYAILFAIFSGLVVISLIATNFIQETKGAHASDLPVAIEMP